MGTETETSLKTWWRSKGVSGDSRVLLGVSGTFQGVSEHSRGILGILGRSVPGDLIEFLMGHGCSKRSQVLSKEFQVSFRRFHEVPSGVSRKFRGVISIQ